jgi:hypothetical protein
MKQFSLKSHELSVCQLISAVAIFIFAFPALTHGAAVQSSVDTTQIRLGESLQLTVSISGNGGDVDISPIKNFKVISRGTSTNYQITNGQSSFEIRYNYTLIPLKDGRLSIPPLPVESGGKLYKTQEIIVQVSKRGQETQGNAGNSRDVFIEAGVSEEAPYEGQQIIYTFMLYHAVQIANGKIRNLEFPGFSAKEIEARKPFRTVISGREYIANEVKYVLIPLNPGEKIIAPATLEYDLVVRRHRQRGNLFDSFFNDSFLNRELEPRVLTTEQIKVDVKPLPPYDGDVKFSGLVGKFNIRAELESDAMKVGDSATLSLAINGTGNIMDAEEPEIKLPENFKIYKDNPEEDIKLGASGYSGKKTFRMALVPVKEGNYALEKVRFSYFDTSKGAYEILSTPNLSLRVSPSEKKDELEIVSAPVSEAGGLKRKVEFTGRDILPLKEEIDALETRSTLSVSRFIFFLLIPVLLCLGVRIAFVFNRKGDDPAYLMAERAEKALKDACKIEESGEAFFSCLYKSVISAILSKARTKGESLTYTEAEQILRSAGYSEEITKQAAALLEKIESAQYSGLNMDKDFREKLLDETKKLVRVLGA